MVEHCGRTERNGWKEITKKLIREGTVGRWDGGQEHGRREMGGRDGARRENLDGRERKMGGEERRA